MHWLLHGVLPLLLLAAFGCAPAARAWGCKGHQAIAFIAEAHLTPRARAAALQILAASPIDPSLPRYCRPRSADPFADASTWADDVRSRRPETSAWHFIDIPRNARRGNLARYCRSREGGCVVSALAAQLRVLKNRRASASARADALRFVIHLVGDMHQPMHDVTNGDLGGNCIPVDFFGRAPEEANPARESFSPNLHQIWDEAMVNRLARGESARRLARRLDRRLGVRIAAWESQPVDFDAWIWQAHALADSVAYGRLPRTVPILAPREIRSCADGNVGDRMLGLHERIGAEYESVAAPAVERQLAEAGARLAVVLNSILR